MITKEANKHWPGVTGVAFIGYYDADRLSGLFPYKSPERVEKELRAIREGGANMLMVCGLKDVVDNPEIAAVFEKYMADDQE